MTKDVTLNPIWYPFTQMKLADQPIHIKYAKDSLLYAEDGRVYIDAISSWWVNLHGHSNSFIAKQIADQALKLEHVIFAGFTHSPAINFAQNLIKILPNSISKIFYSDNGSTAVEVALKMALQYWYNQGLHHKKRIISFEHAYHGDTFGAMSVGQKSVFNAPYEHHLFQVDVIPTPNSENFSSVKEQFETLINTDNIVAFIFEPLVQGAAGMRMYEASYLDTLIKIAQTKKVLCIADEVMTGFGRTGRNFASNYLQEQPDLICLSKGITGGFMPLGVTACSQNIFDAFYSDQPEKTFFHGHSYTANPLACAAALASLELLLSDACQAQITNIAEHHKQFASRLQEELFIKNIRQQGTILALELNTKEDSSYFNSIRHEISRFCLEHGILLRPLGNVIYIMPPYCITSEELEKTYGVITMLIKTLKTKF